MANKVAAKSGASKGTAGGATFFPRLNPRPIKGYQDIRNDVIWSTLVSHLRAPSLSVIFTLVVFGPLYERAVQIWKQFGVNHPTLAPWEDSDGRLFFSIALTTTKFTTMAICHGFFFAIEYFGIFEHYRIDRKEFHLPSPALVFRNIRDVAVNLFLLYPLVTYYVLYPLCHHMGMPSYDAPLPDLRRMWCIYLVSIVLNDWGFYWTHRLVHASSIYKYIHKQHHTFKGTVSYAAEYAHPVEVVLSNIIPTLAGVVLMGAHPAVFMVWAVVRLEQTYEAHSGYSFAGSWLHKLGLTNSDAAAYHDFHHTGNCGNFGAAYLDWLCGTMDVYVAQGGHEAYLKQHADKRWSYVHRAQVSLKKAE